MILEENEVYTPYTSSYQYVAYAPAPILENPTGIHAPSMQDTTPLPVIPPAPQQQLPPHKRQGRGGAILLFSLVLAIIFAVGLFAGLEFAGSNTSSSATTAKTTVTTPATSASTSSSVSTIEAQQEAAIAKIEPAVVELVVTTSQGEQIGNSSALVVGQEVLAIGNPLGITETATKGIVSALNRSVTESTGTSISNAIQTDAAVNPGNSGGALINLQGQLIGIPTLTAVNTESNTAANGVSFAIPSNLVQTVVQQILQQ